jgi:hypothetical protein
VYIEQNGLKQGSVVKGKKRLLSTRKTIREKGRREEKKKVVCPTFLRPSI